MSRQSITLQQTPNRASRRKLSKKNKAGVTEAKQPFVNSRNVSLGLLATAGLMTVGMTCAAAGTSTHTTANAFRNAINNAANGDIVQLDAGGGSGTRFEFQTSEALSVNGRNGLTIRGINYGVNSSVPVLVRKPSDNFTTPFLSIVNSSNIVIQDLGFADFNAGALLVDDSQVSLNNVTFSGNSSTNGGGAISVYGSTLLITDSEFVDNFSMEDGGAISAFGSTITIQDSRFGNNIGEDEGGAVYVDDSTLTIQGSIFYANDSNEDGGGAVSVDDSTLLITDSNFSSNSADREGGAIYITNSIATIEDSSFYFNDAAEQGGAIYAYISDLDILYSTFEDNSSVYAGGAIFGKASNITVGNGYFDGNTAGDFDPDSDIYYFEEAGGAIFMDSLVTQSSEVVGEDSLTRFYTTDSGSLEVNDSRFVNNYSEGDGGAIALRGTDATFIGTYFGYNDSNNNGGAIDFNDFNYQDSITWTLDNTTVIDSTDAEISAELDIQNSTFIGNDTNDEGGAVYVEESTVTIQVSTFEDNIAGDEGGAIYINESTVTIEDSRFDGNESTIEEGGAIYIKDHSTVTIQVSTFEDNIAGDEGGAIYIKDYSTVTIQNSRFYGNESTSEEGGALYIENYSTVTIENSTFENNSAHTEGGAIYIQDESTLSIQDSTFTSNYSGGEGGAIYIYDSAVTIQDSTFEDNSADDDGGAIYINYYSTVTIQDSTFTSNSAVDGGAIVVNYESNVTIQDSTFDGNTASDDGGAIAVAYYYNTVTIQNSTFVHNYAEGDGGAIYSYNDLLHIDGSTFYDNRADANGGAIHAYESTNVEIYDSLFASNHADYGGAISFKNSEFVIADSVFYENSAIYGGGAIFGVQTTNQDSQVLYVVDSIFVDNEVMYQSNNYPGGAIAMVFTGEDPQLGDVAIWSSIFADNSAYDAAAVFVRNADFVEINGSIFNGNVASGAGMMGTTESAVILVDVEEVEIGYSQFYDGGALTLDGVANSNIFASTFTENSGLYGGAIQIGDFTGIGEDFSGYHTLSYNTFVDNVGFTHLGTNLGNSIVAVGSDLNLMANVFASSAHSNNQVYIILSGEHSFNSDFNFTTADVYPVGQSVTWEDLDLTRELGIIQNATAGFGMYENDMEAIGWRPSRSSVLFNAVDSLALAASMGDGVVIPLTDFFTGARANSVGESGLETAGSLIANTPPATPPPPPVTPPPLPPLSHIVIPPAAAGAQTQFLVNGNNMSGTTTVINGGIRLAWDSYQVNITPTLTPGSLSGIATDGTLEYVVGDGTSTTVSGFGLLPLSKVHVYILSTPILLGTFTTDADGKFTGSLVLPSTMASGKHFLQVNGYTKQNTIASGSVAVRVQRVVENVATSKPLIFRVNSSQLTNKNKDLLNQLVQEVRSVPGYLQKAKIIVNGSASPEGIARLNSRLAKSRANAVVSYLKELGIASEIIEVTQEDKRSRSAQVQVIYKNKA
jgi:predicted outer membrane repeat protein